MGIFQYFCKFVCVSLKMIFMFRWVVNALCLRLNNCFLVG